jgi:spermidine synthase
MGSIVYEQYNKLNQLLKTKKDLQEMHLSRIKDLQAQISEMRVQSVEYKSNIQSLEQNNIAISRQSQRKLFFLEHYRLKMHQGVQILSRRLLEER